jgi:Mg-chelatase subunit ChlD
LHTYLNNELIVETLTDEHGFSRFFGITPREGYRLEVSTERHTSDILTNLTIYPGVQANLHQLYPVDYRGLDIVFALDDSGSINVADFNRLISETRQMITNSFTVEDRVSIFTFDSAVRRHGDVFMRPDEAVSALPTIRRGGNTALYQAINIANNEFLSPRARADAKRIIIVITDGMDNMRGQDPNVLAPNANELNITIFTVGVGNVSVGILNDLVTQTGGEFFHINNFQQLENILESIRRDLTTPDSITPAA